MFRKKDGVVIGVLLAAALLLYGGMWLARQGRQASGTVEIYAGGRLFAAATLDETQDVEVAQESGEVNIVHIENGVVTMAYSSCKNQLCLHQGELSADNWTQRALGRMIICLPNQVLVELALSEEEPSMSDPYAPDF